MTDEMKTGPAPYPVPALRVAATYHATDGRVPEEIVVELGGDGPVDPEMVDRAVRAVAGVAATRDYTVHFTQPSEDLVSAMERAAQVTRDTAHQVAATQAAVAASRGAAGAPLVDRAALAADYERRQAEKVGLHA